MNTAGTGSAHRLSANASGPGNRQAAGPVQRFSRLPRCLAVLLLAFFLCMAAVPALAGCRFISHGNREEAKIALTIDDLWDAELVAEILDIVNLYKVPVTFFPCGGGISQEDGALWRRVLDEGHEIGNHSTSHKDFMALSSSSIAWQLDTMQKRLDATLGYHYHIKLVRVPYGSGWREGSGGQVGRAVASAGYDNVIFWDVDETDTASILRKTRNGSIIILHGIRHDIRMLPELIESLTAKGFVFETVSGLLGITTRTTKEKYSYTGAKDETGSPAVFGTVTVTASVANIRAGCLTEAALLMKAAKGDAFPFLGFDPESGWYALLLSNKSIGYIAPGMAKAAYQ